MIEHIPNSEDFARQGVMFLNLAWDAIFELLLDCQNASEWGNIEDDQQTEAYWKPAQTPLSTAHAFAQQGAELILKAQIASVSPFLLVCNPVKDWPKGCDKANVAFADFRTLDAQDLIRACNTVRNQTLPNHLATTFEAFRKQRNSLFHTVDDRLTFSEKAIIRYILDLAQLEDAGSWPHIRANYLQNVPSSKIFPDNPMNRLAEEIELLIELMGRKELLDWFSFDKNNRRYICPECYWALDHDVDFVMPRTAQLWPNEPSSCNVYCFVCGKNCSVVRQKCPNSSCKGNVLSAEDSTCLTCLDDENYEDTI